MKILNTGKYRQYLVYLLLMASILCLFISFGGTHAPGDTARAARKVERILAHRMSILDSYTASVAYPTGATKRNIKLLPEDMVIYRYEKDTLKIWRHQFPVRNDDIGGTFFMQRLTNPRNELPSPLLDLTEQYSFISLGPGWYLARYINVPDGRVIAGLEISNTVTENSLNGVNHHLKLGDRFSIKPLTVSGGSAVYLSGIPQFKVTYESMQGGSFSFSYLTWIAYVLLLCCVMLFLSNTPSLKRYLIALPVLLASGVAMIWWGHAVESESELFSPALYADKWLFSSLGSVLLINLTIVLAIVATFMVRKKLFLFFSNGRYARGLTISAFASLVLCMLGILLLVFLEFRSIILNSSISLQIFEFSDITKYSIAVYLSIISLMVMEILLFLMLRPYLRTFLGWDTGFSSNVGIVLASFAMALYLVALSTIFGLQKEQAKVSIWANRLSIERDIDLEMYLRNVENAIATDAWIRALTHVKDADIVILNRITDAYLMRPSQDFDISVSIFGPAGSSDNFMDKIGTAWEEGLPIYGDSRFLYYTLKGERASYCALFSYYDENAGVSHMFLQLTPKANRSNTGYRAIVGSDTPSRVDIPSKYSYAKYTDKELMAVSGTYTYPIVITDMLEQYMYESEVNALSHDGYYHFLNRISDNEAIIISRPRTGFMKYCFACAFLSLLLYLILSSITRPFRRRYEQKTEGKTYYKSRVTSILIISLVITLVAMASVSVAFVYRRNDANLQALMLDKIDAVQSQMYLKCKDFEGPQDFLAPSFAADLEEVSMVNVTDVNLYNVEGKVFMTTAPEMFDRLYLGSRMDEGALYNIRVLNKRFYISNDHIGERKFYTIYAQVYNEGGDVLAIMSIPYSNDNYDFEKEAVQHLMMMFTMFFILLLLARFAILAVVKRLFKPLGEMGLKMSRTDINSLEYIEYDNDDEISALVGSYNRMVSDLSESTRKLAQAERDKAWSAMARQVAHEIKNPLTPMKLQLQRIIRLKQKNDPSWQEKFDEMTSIVLDHIDMLSETANEFSTFAKLYTEAPTSINLDTMLQEEIAIFDNQEGLEIEYRGFSDAMAIGPKPQLSRVFINILGNAVQAVSGRNDGKVLVSLRKSAMDGYYDIVFEDNGSGVADENLDKLFTPNFTTKSGGTGLGLAISKSVLDKCGATITYSRSFSLNGACFTIVYPENGQRPISA